MTYFTVKTYTQFTPPLQNTCFR